MRSSARVTVYTGATQVDDVGVFNQARDAGEPCQQTIRWCWRHMQASSEANIRLEANYGFRSTDTASGRLRRSGKLTACMDNVGGRRAKQPAIYSFFVDFLSFDGSRCDLPAIGGDRQMPDCIGQSTHVIRPALEIVGWCQNCWHYYRPNKNVDHLYACIYLDSFVTRLWPGVWSRSLSFEGDSNSGRSLSISSGLWCNFIAVYLTSV